MSRTIIDVRSTEEYLGGHVKGSINIPMQEVPQHIEEIKTYDHPVFCCAAGGRSEQVVNYLQSQGIECENGGGWMDVQLKLENGVL